MPLNPAKTALTIILTMAIMLILTSCDSKTTTPNGKPIAAMTLDEQAAYDKALARIQKAKADNATELDLIYLGLTKLPPEIGELTSLKELILDSNSLTSLPPEIFQLTSLEWLDLGDNSLTYLPPEIGKLASLQGLILYNNSLTHLPTEIGELTSLDCLWLDGNNLTDLPQEMTQLTSLSELMLENNKLKVLPQCLTQMDMEIAWEDRYYKGPSITLSGNPLEEPPIAVIKQGKEAIKTWFDDNNK